MKTYWVAEAKLHAFLTSALEGDELSASRPCRFTYRVRAPVPIDRRLGGPQSRSGRSGEQKISHDCPGRKVNPET